MHSRLVAGCCGTRKPGSSSCGTSLEKPNPVVRVKVKVSLGEESTVEFNHDLLCAGNQTESSFLPTREVHLLLLPVSHDSSPALSAWQSLPCLRCAQPFRLDIAVVSHSGVSDGDLYFLAPTNCRPFSGYCIHGSTR